jgi:hypothetical protein
MPEMCFKSLKTSSQTFPRLPWVRLMIKKSAHEYGMLGKIGKYPWVIEDTYEYENANEVIASIKAKNIGPAEAKVQELRAK